jgi:hypothetical protein
VNQLWKESFAMRKRLVMILSAVALILNVGCSSDDDPVVVPPVDLFTAHGDFINLLVGDGTVDTRMNVRMGLDLTVAHQVMPNGAAVFQDLLLAATPETASIGFLLSNGDGTILNDGEQFSLTRDRSYVFMAMGHIDTTSGAIQPKLLQLDPLASPGTGKVQFRFIHALAGNPIAVDVHVNGELISNVAFGTASAPVTFDARSVGKDDLVIVPANVVPDGSNEIWKSSGQILFFEGSHYDAVLAHHPRTIFDGDASGQAAILRFSDVMN